MARVTPFQAGQSGNPAGRPRAADVAVRQLEAHLAASGATPAEVARIKGAAGDPVASTLAIAVMVARLQAATHPLPATQG